MKTKILILSASILLAACQSHLVYKSQDINRMENNKKEGTWITIDDTTEMISIENYSGGVLNGHYVKYHTNGVIAIEGAYKDGKEHGKWKYCLNDGAVMSSRTYRKGKITKMVMYNFDF